MRLRGEVVDLVGAHLLDDARAARCRRRGRHSGVAAPKTRAEAPAQMVDAAGGEARGAAHDAVDFVALFEQKFGEVGAVLPGDPGYQRDFGHRLYSVLRAG